jgi:hypothetical protein
VRQVEEADEDIREMRYYPPTGEAATRQSEEVPPPLDVAARLGMTEPKLARGEPGGSPDAIGRGDLTPRDKRRLEFVIYRAWLNGDWP